MGRIICVGIIMVCGSMASGQEADIEGQRLELMRTRALKIGFTSSVDGFPAQLEDEPLFRYDDATRGYLDGTVWRLGKTGRPLAIVTTELHPKYLGSSSVVVYDFLSACPHAFTARGGDVSRWSPSASGVVMQNLEDAPAPGPTSARRLFQMKQIAQRFSASQVVTQEEPDEKKRTLRLLPRPIEHYDIPNADNGDGAIFLFVAGRMPGLMLFLEATGDQWQYGFGRLSAPSSFVVWFDKKEIWNVPPDFGGWSEPYVASNAAAEIPGVE